MATVFSTSRLGVREFAFTDAADAYAMWIDPDMLRFTGDSAPDDESVIRTDIARWRTVRRQGPGCGFWAAFKGDVFIGDVFVRPLLTAPDRYEIGWHVARPFWGNGYATELARGALDHAHGCGVRRLVALVDPGNAASLRVAVNVGMAPQGLTCSFAPDEPPVQAVLSER